jgi:hypothetical protein
MLIGSSGRSQARFDPDECARRLNHDRSAGSYVGYANAVGFQLSRHGRTAVRIRGTFTASGAGSQVDYRIEFIPMILWALVLAYMVSIPFVLVAVWSGYIPLSALAWVIAVTVIGLSVNLWFSERQAVWLKEYISSVLDLRPMAT